jgi:hypothetical protein
MRVSGIAGYYRTKKADAVTETIFRVVENVRA